MSKFKVGDMVLFIRVPGWRNDEALGLSGTVVATPCAQGGWHHVEGHEYFRVDASNGMQYCCVDAGLRLIPPKPQYQPIPDAVRDIFNLRAAAPGHGVGCECSLCYGEVRA
jgi:hypothetical protein